ncbi:hypothetical protein KUCAC02_006269 [Chaenocephalus aceratus]|uniref:Uncharacterized protein n=1 Tax=Chaenocephalus aceratus TaxID=36190 RepID=A0ACB9VSN3_CHAAC|nr:hypothetical protein KUCAC02_006269 [Chaenocephalus aceratus]
MERKGTRGGRMERKGTSGGGWRGKVLAEEDGRRKRARGGRMKRKGTRGKGLEENDGEAERKDGEERD